MIILREQDCEFPDGQKFMRVIPMVNSRDNPTFTGTLTFAFFDQMKDGCLAVKLRALDNMIKVLKNLQDEAAELRAALISAEELKNENLPEDFRIV